jgi:cyclopropane fatty-acyl-phospholipid synthase-like methyltransferase
MTNEKNVYNAEFYNNQQDGSYKSAKIILPLLLKILPPVNSAVDFGCGTGTWLAVLKELGINEIKGYDGKWVEKNTLRIPSDCLTSTELDKEIILEKRYDLAVSVEVAEHLPVKSAKTFIKTLTEASDIVLFSAAIPYQGGTNHINEQWQEYWYNIFEGFGYAGTDCLRRMIWDNSEIKFWYRQNIILYIRKDIAGRINVHNEYGKMINIVHPEMYMTRIKYPDWGGVIFLPH